LVSNTKAKTLTFLLTVSQLCTEVHSTNNTALSSTTRVSQYQGHQSSYVGTVSVITNFYHLSIFHICW